MSEKLYLHVFSGKIDVSSAWENFNPQDPSFIEVVENNESDEQYQEQWGRYRPANI